MYLSTRTIATQRRHDKVEKTANKDEHEDWDGNATANLNRNHQGWFFSAEKCHEEIAWQSFYRTFLIEISGTSCLNTLVSLTNAHNLFRRFFEHFWLCDLIVAHSLGHGRQNHRSLVISDRNAMNPSSLGLKTCAIIWAAVTIATATGRAPCDFGALSRKSSEQFLAGYQASHVALWHIKCGRNISEAVHESMRQQQWCLLDIEKEDKQRDMIDRLLGPQWWQETYGRGQGSGVHDSSDEMMMLMMRLMLLLMMMILRRRQHCQLFWKDID